MRIQALLFSLSWSLYVLANPLQIGIAQRDDVVNNGMLNLKASDYQAESNACLEGRKSFQMIVMSYTTLCSSSANPVKRGADPYTGWK
ncbi:hypothetical protein CVT25_001502 [Psilocybe cyanescens]|uniref:Uncharacterized protein n=1 Tax=Psilocybe cyanescens TaxID=93625 RepID=A0A409WNJ0_PSICY|nr:hypothetical protein CVT25_001502 [Psilocybe cyanescens]